MVAHFFLGHYDDHKYAQHWGVVVLEMYCIICASVRDHLLCEDWPSPLGMSPGEAARVSRVSLCHCPWRSGWPPR
jgi:hypothetical protein